MKFRREQYTIDGSASLRNSKFEIGEGSHIISLLRNNLYSDPIKAICREIASNCRDAHREVGTPNRPIKISLPTAFEDSIKFRDWGPGISPARMDDVYTKFGNSTKRSDDTETGGFGLGAKTPFAYASQFMIVTTSKIETQADIDIINTVNKTSYSLSELSGKNLKCQHIASLGGEDQNGGVDMFTAEVTDEPTGTEIIIGVQGDDRKLFIEAIIDSMRYWDVLPEIVGANVTFPEVPNEIISGTKWSITENDGSNRSRFYSYSKEQKAIVDGIGYPLQLDQLISTSKDKEVISLCKTLKQTNLLIYFDTGEVELTPSREALQYDKRTKEEIGKRLRLIVKEMHTNLENKIAACKSYAKACEVAQKFSREVLKIPNKVYWKGNLVTDTGRMNIMIKDVCMSNGDSIARLDTYTNEWSYARGGTYKLKRSNNLDLTVSNKVLINDTGKTVPRVNIEEYAAKSGVNRNEAFHVLVATDGEIDNLKKRIKKYCELDVDVLDTDLVSKYNPPKAVKQKKKAQRGTSVVHTYNSVHHSWDKTRINREDDQGVYVVVKERNTVIKLSENSTSNISRWDLSKLISSLDIQTEIYGIKENIVDKLGDGFKPLSEIVEKKKKEFKISKSEAKELAEAKQLLRAFRRPDMMDVFETLQESSDEIESINKEFDKLTEKGNKYDKISSFFNMINEKSPLPNWHQLPDNNVSNTDLSKNIATLVSTYPMLNLVDTWNIKRNQSARDACKEYINLVKSSSQKEVDGVKKAC